MAMPTRSSATQGATATSPSDRSADRPAVSVAFDEALRVFVERMRTSYVRRLRERALTPPMASALRLLGGGPRPLGALADELECDASTVTWIADRLEERGYAAREADPSDRRVRRLAVTGAGRDVLGAVEAAMADDFPGLHALDDDELARLAELLQRAFG